MVDIWKTYRKEKVDVYQTLMPSDPWEIRRAEAIQVAYQRKNITLGHHERLLPSLNDGQVTLKRRPGIQWENHSKVGAGSSII